MQTSPSLMGSSIDPPTAIRFNGLTKRYAQTVALKALDLTIRAGSSFGLVGANGAGKTTLIKCLLDFCEFEHGQIEVFGIASTQTPARSKLAFLPERFNPPYYLTGGDFLRFMSRMYRTVYDPTASARLLGALDLSLDALVKPVRAFSKGMTQKLGLAACLLSGRELFVLDEPTSGLDPKARALFKASLLEARTRGATVFLTSHVLSDVEDLCDEMAVLHAGELRFVGPPAALRERFHAPSLEQAYLACIA
ncbi:MAG: ABC transporter ATP-binding protein [Burkholderiales bacterium]